MSINYTVRFAANPDDFDTYDKQKIRDDFLIQDLFTDGDVNLIYTHYDRFIVGGAKPGSTPLKLESIPPLKADHFLDRRELGIINVGETGMVTVDGQKYTLDYKEALYVGKESRSVQFDQSDGKQPLFYLNSAPAHHLYPTKKITQDEAEIVELGSLQTSNHRVIRKLIVHSIVETCQLQMGMTQLEEGSVWNTMPPHVHDRRMETYFYFELPEDQVVCHFLGEPDNTRHIWMKNQQAVLSPPWSIHCGSGTSNYTFIWGMAGENLDYSDMDKSKPTELR
ncbi:5-dehydro-4-deoxy-D-glucuronate isomerase [Rhodohalobacter sp. SW132]|uniref:5-dehydro-4-deoxy-D-glucuronate isomerase n=1 Tax=Rhodohalobacter sp. SW132 TaxID=2293433 RepID=UPI000E271C66|nr:5-dehydro-4-deoxy-D-glucuronate isomerase [Rhodohalobacter sp. SW132]REL33170.1 5-dehydro-4-deoxy-D-glucuronate isomerase [Rhodohalobacter sp. SW132]